MRVTVTRPQDLGESEVKLWREWQLQGKGLDNPFLAPEFAIAVSRVRDRCEVAVFEDDEGVAGFLPYERHGRSVARAIGLGVSDCQGVVPRPGLLIRPSAVLKPAGLSVWEFDHLLAWQAESSTAVRVGSPVMDISEGYQAYRDARRELSRPHIKPTERKARKMDRDFGGLRLEYGCRDTKMLELLMAWKSAHYRRTGAADRFGWPWVRRLVEESFETVSPEYGGLLVTLYAGDRPVCVDFGLRSRTVYGRWFAAYDAEFGTHSPGLVMLLKLAEAGAADGLHKIDLGKGNEPYKAYFASSEVALAEGWTARPSMRSAIYQARHAPSRAAKSFIKRHPELRRRARDARDNFNRIRRYGFRTAG